MTPRPLVPLANSTSALIVYIPSPTGYNTRCFLLYLGKLNAVQITVPELGKYSALKAYSIQSWSSCQEIEIFRLFLCRLWSV
jgi:hypothetical protein